MTWLPERRFWLLRRLCKVLSALGWVALGLTILITPVGIARAIVGGSTAEIWDWIKYGASGGLFFLYVVFLAQSIEVVLAVEENTKQSTYVLEKLTTLMQQVRDRLGDLSERKAPESPELDREDEPISKH
jgi:cytochrome c biogenesis protein CcdA